MSSIAPRFTTTTLSSLQWLFFIFANTVVVPISIGAAFDLSASETGGMLQSSLLFTGVACLLQGLIGHRYPIMEGHSGVTWGLMLNLSLAAHALGMSLPEVGGGIATGFLLAGGLTLLLGAFKLLRFLSVVFTPMVMRVYLFLLTFQLIFIFLDGMIARSADGAMDVPLTLFSIAVVILVIALKVKGSPAIGSFSILIGIIVGWAVYALLFPGDSSGGAMETSLRFPIFPLGAPNLNLGIVAVSFLAGLINLSNVIAAVEAAAQIVKDDGAPTGTRLNRSYLLTGSYAIVSAVFGLVSYAPFASSIGFLKSTNNYDRKPFLIAAALTAALGLIPPLNGLLVTMPITVGNAVLFVAYLQLFGTSLASLEGTTFDSVTIHRIAVPVLAGVGILTLDPQLFASLPVLLQPLVSNGFIVGVLLSILLEHAMRWTKKDAPS